MDRHTFPYDAEAREDQLCQVIDARIKAIRTDILIGRESTVIAVLERLDIQVDEEEARAILWNAMVGSSGAVGVDHAAAVQAAIYFEAEALAEVDVADMERRRAESKNEGQIERRHWNREALV